LLTATRLAENRAYQSEKLIIYKTQLKGSLHTRAKTLASNMPFAFLDSAGHLSPQNRWSFLATHPIDTISFKNGFLKRKAGDAKESDPFTALRDFLEVDKKEEWQDIDGIPYIGGPVGFISYDFARYVEKLPEKCDDDLDLPDFYFTKPSRVFAHDLKTGDLFICLYRHTEDGFADLNEIADRLNSTDEEGDYKVFGSLRANMEKSDFEDAVEKIRSHIVAGDVYQVNLSQRFEKDFTGESFSLYKKLRELNPGPFCGYLRSDTFSLLSSSPERLVKLDADGKAETRPIAGTRRRGNDIEEDEVLSGKLLLDDKERAEHIMLVDLERNDLGRVCSYGTVGVDELMTIEKYSHVIHIVSNVCADLHPKKDALDLLKAMFPGGTITGCPKVRCMELIEELEPTRRGPYTGSMGYFSNNGNIDFNILIRTIVETKGKVFVQAGAGVVADSKPQREYYETISKAQALFKSLGHVVKEPQWEKMST